MMKNTAAFLALVAGILACAGLALTLLSYAAFFFFMQGIDNMVSPQIDSLSATVVDAQQTVSSASDAAGAASGALANLSVSLVNYAGAGDSIGATISSVSQNALLSAVAPQLAGSAAKLSDASLAMRGAAEQFNATSGSAGAASSSLRQASNDLSSASASMAQAKEGFKSALGMLGIAGLLVMLCGLALFSSVGLVSVSMLLSHYPDFFSKKDAQQAEGAQAQSPARQ